MAMLETRVIDLFGLANVRVGNHIYREQICIPTMCKFVQFGPFYSKIGLDPCITVVKETKKNIHIHIPSSSSLASLFSVEGLCPVDFIHTHKKESLLVKKSILNYYRISPQILVARTDILLVTMLMTIVGLCFALVTIF